MEVVGSSGLTAPRLLAVDPDGAEVGVPALLMTLLNGRPHLRPTVEPDRPAWIGGLVDALMAVHGVAMTDLERPARSHGRSAAREVQPPPPDRSAQPSLEPIEPWFDVETLTVPVWATDPGLWSSLFAELRAQESPPPVDHRTLVHPTCTRATCSGPGLGSAASWTG